MLVLPDDVPGHPLQTSIDVASLAPNAEITVFPWKEPEGAEATHDRPRAPFPPAAHPDARCRAIARITRDRVEVLVEPSLISQDGIIADADSC